MNSFYTLFSLVSLTMTTVAVAAIVGLIYLRIQSRSFQDFANKICAFLEQTLVTIKEVAIPSDRQLTIGSCTVYLASVDRRKLSKKNYPRPSADRVALETMCLLDLYFSSKSTKCHSPSIYTVVSVEAFRQADALKRFGKDNQVLREHIDRCVQNIRWTGDILSSYNPNSPYFYFSSY